MSLQVTFRGVECSGALEARIREIADRLLRCNGSITQCHVTVSSEVVAYQRGFRAQIHLMMPGAHIHADSVAPQGSNPQEPMSALRDAYESARRQLQDLEHYRRGDPLSRPSMLSGI